MRTLLSICLLIFLTSSGAPQHGISPDLASLVEAERSFARASVEKGVRESFLEFLAVDGIVFEPHPTNAREAMLKRPTTRPPFTLDWRPIYADISQAGDLGYTTGPFTLTDQSPKQRPPRYGFYFSIWKKQADSTWKVVLDCGIDTPDHSKEPFQFQPATPAKVSTVSSKINFESERAALIDLEREFDRAVAAIGMLRAYDGYIAEHVRLDRNGRFPVVGRSAVHSYLSENSGEFRSEPMKSDIAQSADLGYTYGSYELKTANVKTVEKGYYVRVWKRDARGKWKIALDTLSPIPPAEQ